MNRTINEEKTKKAALDLEIAALTKIVALLGKSDYTKEAKKKGIILKKIRHLRLTILRGRLYPKK